MDLGCYGIAEKITQIHDLQQELSSWLGRCFALCAAAHTLCDGLHRRFCRGRIESDHQVGIGLVPPCECRNDDTSERNRVFLDTDLPRLVALGGNRQTIFRNLVFIQNNKQRSRINRSGFGFECRRGIQ
ncbi:MAG: hypothetical protein JWM11_3211 [Planctomycetaceae bacterium]|nr:hypothetical protein [Planctomycetaceae bacterium]